MFDLALIGFNSILKADNKRHKLKDILNRFYYSDKDYLDDG